MKKRIQKYRKPIIITSLVIFVFIPLCIHLIFKIHPTDPFFSAEWTAGDVLLFYGSVLAAFGTAFGVFLTVKYSQKNYQEDTRRKVLPFITVTQLFAKHRYNPLSGIFYTDENDNNIIPSRDEDRRPIYEEYQLKRVFFIFKEGAFEAVAELPKEYEELIKHRGYLWERTDRESKALKQKGYMSFPLHVENNGCGPAINFRIGLNKKNTNELFVRPLQLKPEQSLYIHIFVPEIEQHDDMDFYLSFVYQDIFKNRYRQNYEITLTNEKMTLDYGAEQILLEGS